MNEPNLSPAARELIEAARPAEQPAPAAKQRVHAALAATLAAPIPPPGAGSSVMTGTAVKIALACTLTVALGTTAAVIHRRAQPRLPATARASAIPLPLPTKPRPQNDVTSAAGAPALPTSPLSARAPVQAPGRADAGIGHRQTRPIPARLALAPSSSPPPAATPPPAPAPPPPAGVPPTAAAESWLPPAAPAPPPARVAAELRSPAPSPSRAHITPLVTAQAAAQACSAREELALLARAQAALRDHNGRTALAHLDQHARQCPSPRFGEEQSAARVLALCLLHRTEQALAEAARLAAQAPRSPQLVRLRTSCAAAAIPLPQAR